MTATQIYKELRQSHTLKQLAQKLNLHTGTLKRWEAEQKIPQNYVFDLNFLAGNKFNLNKQNYKDNDEYFTKKEIALYCFDIFMKFLKNNKIAMNEYVFIEPSCGDLSFYNLMPESKIGIDLNAKDNHILKKNFLDFVPKNNKKYIVLGNPPFGLRGNLALRFINHASNFASFIAFILPPLFNSDGKGSPKKRIKNMELVHSQNLPLNSFIYPNGKEVEVATLFQIWANKNMLDSLNVKNTTQKTCKNYIKIYSLSDGGTPSSTRNKKMLNACDLYLPSTCFHSRSKPKMRIYYDFESLPNRRGYGIKILQNKKEIKQILENINWESVSFKGTNSSLNLRTSLIENALIEHGIYDKELF